MAEREPSAIASDYLANAQQISKLEAANKVLRDELASRLSANTVSEPRTWELGSAKVTLVRGRESRTLDRGKLVRLGVTADVLDKATVVSTGKASIRIEPFNESSKV